MTPNKRRGSQPAAHAAANILTHRLPKSLADGVKAALKDWDDRAKVARLWTLDAKLWTGADEGQWLGWLNIADQQLHALRSFDRLSAEAGSGRFTHALLLGMGGSSLGPEVLATTFGRIKGFPELHVLDSTHPAQIQSFEDRIDLKKTLFLVASKSGTTLEPNILKAHFFERAQQVLGAQKARERFVIITDPSSALEKAARDEGIPAEHIFYGVRNIGGRFSALSNFGMVPAAVLGLDLARFLGRAQTMARACAVGGPAAGNPGVLLGAVLGVAHNAGRNKLTLVASPGLHDLGAWLEQLVAESTGKQSRAIIPVDREAPGDPAVYGGDRLFVYLRLQTAPDAAQDRAIARLERAGQPVVRISVDAPYGVAEEMFRWEIATAVAGSIMGIHPFNQPDVEASKIASRDLTSQYEQTGRLPAETPILDDAGIKLFADERNAGALKALVGADASLNGYVKAHLNRLSAGDYFALLAYLDMNPPNEKLLQGLRHRVRDTQRVATCLGFGPRFLHSTGQAYKGGPNSGLFLQITSDHPADLAVPGAKYTFGTVVDAQARGDFQVLAERGRRVLRVHLGADARAGLARLAAAVEQAVG